MPDGKNSYKLISLKCPKCGKRAFDIPRFLKEDTDFYVYIKCRNCNRQVKIKPTIEFTLKKIS